MTQPTTQKSEKQPEVDWYLESLVHIVTASKVSMGVTLSVGGTVITGQLISGKEFLELSAGQVSDVFKRLGVSEESAKSIKESFSNPAQKLYREEADPQPTGYGYIHLKNARIVAGASSHTLGGSIWRSRLSAVDGFSLGELTQAP
ncbi:gas vesicle accessory protein GvpU [Pyxidicoccus sp. 3LFB2]